MPRACHCSFGEKFDFAKHPQGTEIKAITYSNMQIITPDQTFTANADAAPALDETATPADGAGSAEVARTASPKDSSVPDKSCYGAYDVFV
ncbi:hypothetical protein EON67_02105, partial [archaeon]